MENNIGGSEALVRKWEKALVGIDDSYLRKATATLFENQGQTILAEREKLNEDAVGTGTTTVGQLGTFQKFAFPLIRRVYPELIANSLVGVQPMNSPTSQIFYVGHSRVYGSTAQNVYSKYNLTYRGQVNEKIGSRADNFPAASGGTGQFNKPALPDAQNLGLSQADLEDATIDTSSVISELAGSVSTTFGGGIAGWPDADTILGWSVSAGERLQGTSIPEISFQIQQQPIVARTRKMRALWTIEASQDLKAYHNLDLESELTDLLSKELSLEIDRELIEDLRMIAYDVPSLSAGAGGWYEASLNNANSNNFQDIGGLGPNETAAFAPGQWEYDFNADIPTANTRGSNVFLIDLTASALRDGMAPQHIGQVYSNLLALVNFASQDIYRTTHRGPGTVLVTSPIMATFLESAAKLEGGLPQGMGPTNMGKTITYKGKFAGKYDLFVDPLFPEDEILVGYKGDGPMDAGFFYAPYIPIMSLPTITDPESFQPRKGILTRYGKAAVEPKSRFYRVIRAVGVGQNYLLDPFARVNRHIGQTFTGYQ